MIRLSFSISDRNRFGGERESWTRTSSHTILHLTHTHGSYQLASSASRLCMLTPSGPRDSRRHKRHSLPPNGHMGLDMYVQYQHGQSACQFASLNGPLFPFPASRWVHSYSIHSPPPPSLLRTAHTYINPACRFGSFWSIFLFSPFCHTYNAFLSFLALDLQRSHHSR